MKKSLLHSYKKQLAIIIRALLDDCQLHTMDLNEVSYESKRIKN
jgi:hypothetical protein